MTTYFLYNTRNSFLIILLLSNICLIPFFPLYLKYLNISVLQIGIIRACQIWSAATFTILFIHIGKKLSSNIVRRCSVAFALFLTIGICVSLLYVPPEGSPYNVTHCKEQFTKAENALSSRDYFAVDYFESLNLTQNISIKSSREETSNELKSAMKPVFSSNNVHSAHISAQSQERYFNIATPPHHATSIPSLTYTTKRVEFDNNDLNATANKSNKSKHFYGDILFRDYLKKFIGHERRTVTLKNKKYQEMNYLENDQKAKRKKEHDLSYENLAMNKKVNASYNGISSHISIQQQEQKNEDVSGVDSISEANRVMYKHFRTLEKQKNIFSGKNLHGFMKTAQKANNKISTNQDGQQNASDNGNHLISSRSKMHDITEKGKHIYSAKRIFSLGFDATNDTLQIIHDQNIPSKSTENKRMSDTFVSAFVLAILYELFYVQAKISVEVFWTHSHSERTKKVNSYFGSIYLESKLLWKVLLCYPLLATFAAVSPCPYQIAFHFVFAAVLLTISLFLCVFIVPMSSPRIDSFRKRKPSKPERRNSYKLSIMHRLFYELTRMIIAFCSALSNEFLLWHVETLQGFPFNYEFLYCGYYFISLLVQIFLNTYVNGIKGTGDTSDSEEDSHDSDQFANESSELNSYHHKKRNWKTITGCFLLSGTLFLVPFITSATTVLFLAVLNGVISSFLFFEIKFDTTSHCMWQVGYGLGCLFGAVLSGALGIKYAYYTASLMMLTCSSGWSVHRQGPRKHQSEVCAQNTKD